MTLQDRTQNIVLLNGAEKQGHNVPREPAIKGDPNVKCLHCGKFFYDICEDAMADVKANRPISRCDKEKSL